MFDLGELSWDWNRCKFAAAQAFLTVILIIRVADWTFFQILHHNDQKSKFWYIFPQKLDWISLKRYFCVSFQDIGNEIINFEAPWAYFFSRKIFCCSPRFKSYRFYFIHIVSEEAKIGILARKKARENVENWRKPGDFLQKFLSGKFYSKGDIFNRLWPNARLLSFTQNLWSKFDLKNAVTLEAFSCFKILMLNSF